MELAIDTSTRYAGVALSVQGEPIHELAWRSDQNHTVELAPAVQHLLERARASLADLQALFVALGPGGFSALRVGLSFAKGLATGLHVPLVGIGTLELEAFPYTSTGLLVCPLLPAGRGEVAWALFRESSGDSLQVQEARISPLEELASFSEQFLFCGEGAFSNAAFLREHGGAKSVVVAVPPPTRRASQLARLGAKRLAQGLQDSAATLQPVYLRRPSVTLRKEQPA